MPGNKNKTQVGSRTGGENKRRSGEVDVAKPQREGILPISMLIPSAFYISHPLWCFAGKEFPIIGSMQCYFLTTSQYHRKEITSVKTLVCASSTCN